jgi:hypothetical protein
MSTTADLVDRLIRLCREVVIRAEEEIDRDFTVSLGPLQREMKDVLERLVEEGILKYETKTPFELRSDVFLRDDGVRNNVPVDELPNETFEIVSEGLLSEYRYLVINDPFGTLGDRDLRRWLLFAQRWDEDGWYAGSSLWSHKRKDQIDWLRKEMGHWVRFLKVKTEELKAASAAGTSKPETTASVSQLSAEQLPRESEEEILKKWFPRHDGLKTAKKVLELTRAGKSQRQITGLVGRWPGTVSGIVKKLRKAGLLPKP